MEDDCLPLQHKEREATRVAKEGVPRVQRVWVCSIPEFPQ